MQRIEHDQWKSSDVARLLSLVDTERRYYQDIFAILPVAVAAVDELWGLTAFNREFRRLLGLQMADLAGVRLPDLIPDPVLEAAMEDVRATGIPQPACLVHIGAMEAGIRLSVSIQRAPGWQLGDGAELLLTLQEATAAPEPPPPVVTPDIIEQHKRAAVERLGGRVAHVANNLLMIIGGYAEELASSLPWDDPRRADIAEIVKASDRLAALTKSLNSLTRPPAVYAENFEAVAWAQALAAQLGIEANTDVSVPLILHGSPSVLEQAVLTAHRYFLPYASSGKLVLSARPTTGDSIDITLSLQGAELPPDAVERIFEPFSGAKEGTDPPLGLAGLIRPLEQLGCIIRILDNATLLIRCPQGKELPPPKPKPRILLLEDEPGIRSLILKSLERDGFAVIQASSAADALAACALEAQRPDLLITDIRMPGLQGRALAGAILAEHPGIQVLYISGSTGDEELDRQIGQEELLPGTRFLAKPFTVSALLTQVNGLLGKSN